jgi:hypothetical protein
VRRASHAPDYTASGYSHYANRYVPAGGEKEAVPVGIDFGRVISLELETIQVRHTAQGGHIRVCCQLTYIGFCHLI